METIVQGMKFGKTAKEVYDVLCKKYDWNDTMFNDVDDEYIKQAVLNLNETHKVSSEGYSVWFLEHSQLNPQKDNNYPWEATVSSDWNFITDKAKTKEAWLAGRFNKLPVGHKVCIFVRDLDGCFMFLGIYKLIIIDPINMQQTFKISLREYRRLNPF